MLPEGKMTSLTLLVVQWVRHETSGLSLGPYLDFICSLLNRPVHGWFSVAPSASPSSPLLFFCSGLYPSFSSTSLVVRHHHCGGLTPVWSSGVSRANADSDWVGEHAHRMRKAEGVFTWRGGTLLATNSPACKVPQTENKDLFLKHLVLKLGLAVVMD